MRLARHWHDAVHFRKCSKWRLWSSSQPGGTSFIDMFITSNFPWCAELRSNRQSRPGQRNFGETWIHEARATFDHRLSRSVSGQGVGTDWSRFQYHWRIWSYYLLWCPEIGRWSGSRRYLLWRNHFAKNIAEKENSFKYENAKKAARNYLMNKYTLARITELDQREAIVHDQRLSDVEAVLADCVRGIRV